jgi:hypothetical protein
MNSAAAIGSFGLFGLFHSLRHSLASTKRISRVSPVVMAVAQGIGDEMLQMNLGLDGAGPYSGVDISSSQGLFGDSFKGHGNILSSISDGLGSDSEIERVLHILTTNAQQWSFVESQLLEPQVNLQIPEIYIPLRHLTTTLELLANIQYKTKDMDAARDTLERTCPLTDLLPTNVNGHQSIVIECYSLLRTIYRDDLSTGGVDFDVEDRIADLRAPLSHLGPLEWQEDSEDPVFSSAGSLSTPGDGDPPLFDQDDEDAQRLKLGATTRSVGLGSGAGAGAGSGAGRTKRPGSDTTHAASSDDGGSNGATAAPSFMRRGTNNQKAKSHVQAGGVETGAEARTDGHEGRGPKCGQQGSISTAAAVERAQESESHPLVEAARNTTREVMLVVESLLQRMQERQQQHMSTLQSLERKAAATGLHGANAGAGLDQGFSSSTKGILGKGVHNNKAARAGRRRSATAAAGATSATAAVSVLSYKALALAPNDTALLSAVDMPPALRTILLSAFEGGLDWVMERRGQLRSIAHAGATAAALSLKIPVSPAFTISSSVFAGSLSQAPCGLGSTGESNRPDQEDCVSNSTAGRSHHGAEHPIATATAAASESATASPFSGSGSEGFLDERSTLAMLDALFVAFKSCVSPSAPTATPSALTDAHVPVSHGSSNTNDGTSGSGNSNSNISVALPTIGLLPMLSTKILADVMTTVLEPPSVVEDLFPLNDNLSYELDPGRPTGVRPAPGDDLGSLSDTIWQDEIQQNPLGYVSGVALPPLQMDWTAAVVLLLLALGVVWITLLHDVRRRKMRHRARGGPPRHRTFMQQLIGLAYSGGSDPDDDGATTLALYWEVLHEYFQYAWGFLAQFPAHLRALMSRRGGARGTSGHGSSSNSKDSKKKSGRKAARSALATAASTNKESAAAAAAAAAAESIVAVTDEEASDRDDSDSSVHGEEIVGHINNSNTPVMNPVVSGISVDVRGLVHSSDSPHVSNRSSPRSGVTEGSDEASFAGVSDGGRGKRENTLLPCDDTDCLGSEDWYEASKKGSEKSRATKHAAEKEKEKERENRDKHTSASSASAASDPANKMKPSGKADSKQNGSTPVVTGSASKQADTSTTASKKSKPELKAKNAQQKQQEGDQQQAPSQSQSPKQQQQQKQNDKTVQEKDRFEKQQQLALSKAQQKKQQQQPQQQQQQQKQQQEFVAWLSQPASTAQPQPQSQFDTEFNSHPPGLVTTEMQMISSNEYNGNGNGNDSSASTVPSFAQLHSSVGTASLGLGSIGSGRFNSPNSSTFASGAPPSHPRFTHVHSNNTALSWGTSPSQAQAQAQAQAQSQQQALYAAVYGNTSHAHASALPALDALPGLNRRTHTGAAGSHHGSAADNPALSSFLEASLGDCVPPAMLGGVDCGLSGAGAGAGTGSGSDRSDYYTPPGLRGNTAAGSGTGVGSGEGIVTSGAGTGAGTGPLGCPSGFFFGSLGGGSSGVGGLGAFSSLSVSDPSQQLPGEPVGDLGYSGGMGTHVNNFGLNNMNNLNNISNMNNMNMGGVSDLDNPLAFGNPFGNVHNEGVGTGPHGDLGLSQDMRLSLSGGGLSLGSTGDQHHARGLSSEVSFNDPLGIGSLDGVGGGFFGPSWGEHEAHDRPPSPPSPPLPAMDLRGPPPLPPQQPTSAPASAPAPVPAASSIQNGNAATAAVAAAAGSNATAISSNGNGGGNGKAKGKATVLIEAKCRFSLPGGANTDNTQVKIVSPYFGGWFTSKAIPMRILRGAGPAGENLCTLRLEVPKSVGVFVYKFVCFDASSGQWFEEMGAPRVVVLAQADSCADGCARADVFFDECRAVRMPPAISLN